MIQSAEADLSFFRAKVEAKADMARPISRDASRRCLQPDSALRLLRCSGAAESLKQRLAHRTESTYYKKTKCQSFAVAAAGIFYSKTNSTMSIPSKRIRTLFVPGFVIGFLLTGAIVCGGIGMMLGLDELSLADIRNSDDGWSPPEVTPTPESAALEDAFAPAEPTEGIFSPGDTVFNVTNSRVNIRSSPGHLGKPGEDIYAQAQPADRMEILGGPSDADSLTWWLIRYTAPDGSSIEGWIAEATSSGVTILGK